MEFSRLSIQESRRGIRSTQTPEASRKIRKWEIEIGPRQYDRRFRQANYAEGGAREAICKETRETVGAESSGSGKQATGRSTAALWPVSGCAAT
jgi:hypothetical protein